MGPPPLSHLVALAWVGGINEASIRFAQALYFTPGDGLKLKGSEADQKKYLAMVRREMIRSPTFHKLMLEINGDKAHPVEVTLGRNQRGLFFDSFESGDRWGTLTPGMQELDLADLDSLPAEPPADHPNAITQGEVLIHAMAEARTAAEAGDSDYVSAHAAGIKAQNDYRDERGQQGHRLPMDKDPERYRPGPGRWTMFYDNGYRETWEKSGSGDRLTKIERWTGSPP